MRHNLILVHSFPTNSLLLRGLFEFLSDHFNVFFIDLPGFNKNVPANHKISLQNYIHFLEDKIRELKLSSYWLAGVSFGFLVVNGITRQSECRGIIAIEPFINAKYLYFNVWQRFLYKFFFSTVCLLGTEKKVYFSKPFQLYLRHTYGYRNNTIISSTIDARTFFHTGRMLLCYKEDVTLHPIPYILVINKHDDSIDAKKTAKRFSLHSAPCITVYSASEHFPASPNKEYFIKATKKEDIQRMQDFMTDMHNTKKT